MLEDDMQLAKLSNRQSLPRRDLTSVVFPGFLVPGGNICKYSTIPVSYTHLTLPTTPYV